MAGIGEPRRKVRVEPLVRPERHPKERPAPEKPAPRRREREKVPA